MRANQRVLTILINLLWSLPGLLLLSACLNADDQPVVVTEVVLVEGEEVVVTRLVRQTVIATPPPDNGSEDESPIQLDINFPLSDIPSIDPQTSDNQAGIDLIENMFVGLTRFNHITNRVEPELAQSWEVEENGRRWTFFLRDDIFWVRPTDQRINGFRQVTPVAPVTADDVVFAVQRACTRDTDTPDAVTLFLIEGCEQLHALSEPTTTDLNRIGVTAVDSNTVQFTLTKPAAQFLTISSLWMIRPVPKFLIEEFEEAWTDPENLLTSGPFIPIGERFSLQRNPIWPLPRSNGNVDKVNITYLSDNQNAFSVFEAKQLDVIPLPELQESEERDRLVSRSNLVTGQTLFYVGFNFESGVFREPEVRRAFSAAIDREQLIEELFPGEALPMRHLLPPGVIGAVPPAEVGMGYDPDFARIQMQSSGFGSCRLMPPVTLLVTSSDQSLRQAEILRDMWVEELGCEEQQIVIEQASFGSLLANTRQDAGARRPDMWELGWASYYPDAQNWFSDLLHCDDSENRQARPCAEVDTLIRQAALETDVEARAALYREMENLFFSRSGSVPLIPLYVPGTLVLRQGWLSYVPARFGGQQYDTFEVDAILKELEQSR